MLPYKRLVLCVLIVASTLLSVESISQPASLAQTITVSGEVIKELTLNASSIGTMKHVTVKAKDKDGVRHTYTGVPLAAILAQAGVPLGSELRGRNLIKFVLVKAADGYEAVFSLPEIDPEFTDRIIVLADKQDDKPFPDDIGYRIIVPDEKKHARWVRNVTSIQVLMADK